MGVTLLYLMEVSWSEVTLQWTETFTCLMATSLKVEIDCDYIFYMQLSNEQVASYWILVFVQRCLGSPELRLGKEQNMFKNREKKKKYIYIQEVCKSIFAWNSAQYVEAEQNKYYEREKGTQLHFPYIYIYNYTSKPTQNRLNSKFIACMYI